jgi:hypothetical protein
MSNKPDPRLTPERMQAESRLRVQRALVRIQRAQDELRGACEELSALCYGDPLYRATGKLAERVHDHWYKVQAFMAKGKYWLDRDHVEAILERDAEHRTVAARKPAPWDSR